jgi:D-beta-D-heptose 7-phosphate kinase/D-beta-D-heptose 1-phosphate adenosyltransferase
MEMILGVPRNARDKIVSREEAVERIADWSRKRRRTVFTNGCFDILHQGHVRYLAEARKIGDALVIGLNSDASIRRIKGEKRPILGEQERAELVASLECVDLVTLFEEDDPGELIRQLQPHYLVKGADWPKDKVIGRETVEALGGQVVNIPLVEGRSTTNIIETILERFK